MAAETIGDGSSEGRETRPRPSQRAARLPLQVEPHPITRQALRIDPSDPEQWNLELVYPGEKGVGRWRVTADNESLIIEEAPTRIRGAAAIQVPEPTSTSRPMLAAAAAIASALPRPLANDVLVVFGEEINARTFEAKTGRAWNIDSAADRKIAFSVQELLRRIGYSDSEQNRRSLIETCVAFAKMRIHLKGPARRRKSRGKPAEADEIVTGLFNRFAVRREPVGQVIEFELSTDFAAMFVEDRRILPTEAYWQLDSGIARRLYRLLDWATYHGTTGPAEELRLPVHFLRDRIPIAREKTAQIVRALERAHQELVDVGYLRELPGDPVPATAEDLRRFPTYPGKRAKLLTFVYKLQQPVTHRVTDGVTEASGKAGSPSGTVDPRLRAVFGQLGMEAPPATADTPLEERVARVATLTGDLARQARDTFRFYCAKLSEQQYQELVQRFTSDPITGKDRGAPGGRMWVSRAKVILGIQ